MPAASVLSDEDPLDALLKPPDNETSAERDIRMAKEEEAKQISRRIDDGIKAERQARKRRRIVRLLLLGQSESGKSTTLRQFQRLYTPTAFREERILWRAVIQLNIVRSIRTIIAAITHRRRNDPQDDSGEESDTSPAFHQHTNNSVVDRLRPLAHIESMLIAKLVTSSEDDLVRRPSLQAQSSSSSALASSIRSHRRAASASNQEIFVRPGLTWKGALSRARVHYPSTYEDPELGYLSGDSEGYTSDSKGKIKERKTRPISAGNTGLESVDEIQKALHYHYLDMEALWNDPSVRNILQRRKIRLEEGSGFFLDDLPRVTSPKFMPSDDDVLRARLKTVGVSEYRFFMEVNSADVGGKGRGTEWRIVDVGGSRSQRPTWAPFFDNVDAIIFLAPISGFDQVLTEDKTVNRLEDSVLLWKAVCSNKLLANVDLILFLNKCDILEWKLKSGIQISKYVPSYGDRANDSDTVSKYFRSKFSAIHREYSPNPRKFYVFCTSVTDTATTAGIIASVRDMVIRQHLKQSKLL